MKILALETSSMAGSIAIQNDNRLIAEVMLDIKVVHSERLMSSIEWLLKASLTSIEDIDAFAISIGPGSFTGLRIGLSTVKGLSYAAKKPIITVPTLDAFARRIAFSPYDICPMLDARKNEIYTALYRWRANALEKIILEMAISPRDFLSRIEGDTIFMGEGARIYKDLIKDILKTNAIFAPPHLMYPSASTVAEIAMEKLKRGEVSDPVGITPFYIRKSEAEIHWKG
jgi:tRNA threonylcarbamoyladenosine biosynthesis protein TsaB